MAATYRIMFQLDQGEPTEGYDPRQDSEGSLAWDVVLGTIQAGVTILSVIARYAVTGQRQTS